MHADFPCGRITRRNALYRFGLLGSAIGAMWGQDEAGARPDGGTEASPEGQIGHPSVHVRRRQSHRHLRSEGQQVRGQDHGRHRVRRQSRPPQASRDSMPQNLQELWGIGHPGFGLVSQRGRSDRRHRGGPILLVARDQSLPGGDRDDHRASRPPIRLADSGQLGLVRARLGQSEPADVRQHGAAFLLGAVERRLYGRDFRSHAVSNRRHADSRPESARRTSLRPNATGRWRRCSR